MTKKDYSQMFFIEAATMIQLNPNGFFNNDIHQAKYLHNSNIITPEQNIIQWCGPTYGNKDKLFIDIGAHVGSYSWMLASYFKHTHAFEPNRRVYNCMCANIYLKKLSEYITTHCNGLSDKSGTMTYYDRSGDGGGNGFSITKLDDESGVGCTDYTNELVVKKLDDYNFNDIGFIKIDVEGHEISVLDGAIETIKRNDYPPILFESWKPGMHHNLSIEYTQKLRDKLFARFEEVGYTVNPINGWEEIFVATKTIS
jgi:FkbM family methyltransferase